MKTILFSIAAAFSVSAFATPSPVSQFVQQTIVQGEAILHQKSNADRLRNMCALMNQRLGSVEIADRLLGEYASNPRDQKAVAQFRAMIPSIIITKVIQAANGHDGRESGTFTVGDTPKDMGNGYLQVTVTVTPAGGKAYTGEVLVHDQRGFKIVDGTYNGRSAVSLVAREYKGVLDQNARALPVTALVQYVQGDADYTACP
jgi:hypothetical protein